MKSYNVAFVVTPDASFFLQVKMNLVKPHSLPGCRVTRIRRKDPVWNTCTSMSKMNTEMVSSPLALLPSCWAVIDFWLSVHTIKVTLVLPFISSSMPLTLIGRWPN